MLEQIGQEISEIFYKYLAVRSDTGTGEENNTDQFFRDRFVSEPYFLKNPGHFGTYTMESDALNRSINWALVKNSGETTVVLLHHSDTVGTEDYKEFSALARSPDALTAEFRGRAIDLSPEARGDLESDEFVFGHGTADMKAGGAIQIALLKRFSRHPPFMGNLLLLALPDEENLSLGMRHSSLLMETLKKRFGLKYLLMINSEPHQRKTPALGMLSEGSIGKILPFVYVRGILAHVGQIFSGLNPLNLLSEIVRRIELNISLCDVRGREVTPPPTCLSMKDSKNHYDVSLPRSAFACFSVLTLGTSPEDTLTHLENICSEAVVTVLKEFDQSHSQYRRLLGENLPPISRSVDVIRFDRLLHSASERGITPNKWKTCLSGVVEKVRSGLQTMPQGTWEVVESLLDETQGRDPIITIGFVPPFYPGVTNEDFGDPEHPAMTLADHLIEYAFDTMNQNYSKELFYTGISDLSYSSIQSGSDLEKTLISNMPLYGSVYSIPFDLIRKNAVPCINIGPWGKDFHTVTERVHREDLLVTTPRLILEAIRYMLEGQTDT